MVGQLSAGHLPISK